LKFKEFDQVAIIGCTDCLCACFCTPCDLIQQDKEAEFRENERVGFVSAQPKPNPQMQYGGGYST
jgi:hypothetical protein